MVFSNGLEEGQLPYGVEFCQNVIQQKKGRFATEFPDQL
jgi:hypothetical protein